MIEKLLILCIVASGNSLLSNSLVTFNLENVSLLNNLNINSKNGLAYKKTCSEPQILGAIQNAFILIYPSEIYP